MRCALLLEEHNAFRQALAFLLSHDSDIEAVAEASSIEEGRATALRELDDIDVVVTELMLADGSAAELLRALDEADGDVSVLVLTSLKDRHVHDLALKLGAAQVLTKDVSVEDIVVSIKELGGV
jgi:two-component system, NarL family, response regulator DevR